MVSASRRSKHLSLLGVVQYRRRSLQLAEQRDVMPEQIADATEVNSDRNRPNLSQITGSSQIADSAPVKNARSDTAIASGSIETGLQAELSFELLIWRDEHILVLDFSETESNSDVIKSKHSLTNNILKAIWPERTKGVDVHQHLWPITAVDTGAASAEQWLVALVAGHLQHNQAMPIWVMGDIGLQMLFADRTNFDELMGSSCRHQTLGVDLLITPSLSAMLANSKTKIQVWQLLKSLRRFSDQH